MCVCFIVAEARQHVTTVEMSKVEHHPRSEATIRFLRSPDAYGRRARSVLPWTLPCQLPYCPLVAGGAGGLPECLLRRSPLVSQWSLPTMATCPPRNYGSLSSPNAVKKDVAGASSAFGFFQTQIFADFLLAFLFRTKRGLIRILALSNCSQRVFVCRLQYSYLCKSVPWQYLVLSDISFGYFVSKK